MANTIEGVSTTPGTRTIANKTGSGTGNAALSNVDFTTYITLLTQQLKNQDPLKPMDSQQFTSEIATYAQLEQQIKGNDLLQKLSDNKDYGMQTLAASYLGKEVLADNDKISFNGSAPVDFGYTLSKAAAGAEVVISDSSGKAVRTLKVDTQEGLHALTWDGKDDKGALLGQGTYSLKVKAVDGEGDVISATSQTYLKAMEMVTQSDGTISVKLSNGKVVDFSDIKSLRSSV